MKFLKSISLFCFIILLLFLYNYMGKSTDISENKEITHTKEETAKENEPLDLSVSTKQDVTTCDTVYEIETYIGNSHFQAIEAIPFSFTGLNRAELQKEIERYEMSPTFQDKQKGFVSIDLLSFHPDKITVKKVYEESKEKVIYYLKVIDHELVVFRSDEQDPYMPTDLTLDMLPETVQQDVINTKCFNDIREVYDFLESYTS